MYTVPTNLRSMVSWILYFLKSDTFEIVIKYYSTQGHETMGGDS